MTDENENKPQAIAVQEQSGLTIAEKSQPPANTLNVEEDKDASRLKTLEVKERLYGLTEDEKKEKDALTGSLSQNTSKNTPWPNDQEKDKLKDQDVLDALYEMMTDGVLEAELFVRKVAIYGWNKAMDSAGNRKDDKKDPLTNQAPDEFKTEYLNKQTGLKEQSDKDLAEIREIGKAIEKGTLFKDKNKDLLYKFELITREDPKQGQKTYDAVKEMCTDKQSDKEDREKAAKEFYTYNGGTVLFNFINNMAANDIAYAEVEHRAKKENMTTEQKKEAFDASKSSYLDSIKKMTEEEQQIQKEEISKRDFSDKTLSKINIGDLYIKLSPKTNLIKTMGPKAVAYARLNADISERNPYVNAIKNTINNPILREQEREAAKRENRKPRPTMTIYNREHAFTGGTLKDAVNYMKELRHDTLQTTSMNNPDTYNREKVKKHLERLKNKGSHEIIQQLRSRYDIQESR